MNYKVKLFSVFLISFIYAPMIYSQRQNITDFQLKGPVYKLIEHEFESDQAYAEDDYSTIDTIIFRKDGSLKYNRRFRANGEILVEEKTELNQNRRIVSYSRYQLGLKDLREKYNYNLIENHTVKEIFENDILTKGYKFYYDSKGNMIKMQTKDSRLIPILESKYTYDENNKLIFSETINLKNQSTTQREYHYDIESRRTKIVESDPLNNKTSTTAYKYDSNGNQTSYSTTRNGIIRESKTEYKYYNDYYEKKGYSSEGYQDSYFKLDYNDNIMTRIFYNKDGNVKNTSYYILDQYGNWIKETFVADDFYAISVRTFEYYKEK